MNFQNGERAQEAMRLLDFSWAKYKTMSRSFKMYKGGEEEWRMNPQETGLRDLKICPLVTLEEVDMNDIWATMEVCRVKIKGVWNA